MGEKVNVVSAEVEPRLKLNLVARDAICRGDAVVQCSADNIIGRRTWRTIQIGPGRHLRNQYIDYIDHHCEPNTVFDIERLALMAIRDVAAGESVTFFYPGSEVELSRPFPCECGSSSCIGPIQGAFYLAHNQMRRALRRGYCTSFIAAHLERLLGYAQSVRPVDTP